MKKLFVLIFASLVVANCSEKPEGTNVSFRPGELWLDNNGVHINAHGGGFIFKDERYYWFGEHKVAGNAGNRAQVGVRCYSSKDLYNWKDEGIALAVVENDTLSPIAKGSIIERPKVIYNAKANKYVMWFHLELLGQGYKAANYGVAVSDNITGPYTFVKNGRVNPGIYAANAQEFHKGSYKGDGTQFTGGSGNNHTDSLNIHGRDFEGGQMSRDMTLFVDDNGKAYHIYSSEENATTQIAELSDDYLSHSGKYVRVFVNRYMEAPAICKHNGKYYFIASGCTGWAPNKARSAVTTDIMGGEWTEMENPCVGENSDLTFGGQSTYIIPVEGKKDAYIFVADIWRPEDAIDGRYIMLPIEFSGDTMTVNWMKEWDLTYFDKK